MSQWTSNLRDVAALKTVYPKLYLLALAIRKHEGWTPGSRSWRQNNPGNLRWSAYQKDTKDDFAVFNDENEGMVGLLFDLYCKCSGRTRTGLGPDSTLEKLIYVWAPPADNNNSAAYVKAVSDRIGVRPDTKLSYFLEP